MKKRNFIMALLVLALSLAFSMTGEAATPKPRKKQPAQPAKNVQSDKGRLESDLSMVGVYRNKDGREIHIVAADPDNLVALVPVNSEYGFYNAEEFLFFTHVNRTRAVLHRRTEAGDFSEADFQIEDDKLHVKADNPKSWINGDFTRVKDCLTWRKNPDGSVTWLNQGGLPGESSMSLDGWPLDDEGCKDTSRGMTPFTPEHYTTMSDPHAQVQCEKLDFRGKVDGWEDFRLSQGEKRRNVASVTYSAIDHDNNISRRELEVFNTAEGYVLEDPSGEIFGWFYPVNVEVENGTVLMLQKNGSKEFKIFAIDLEAVITEYSEAPMEVLGGMWNLVAGEGEGGDAWYAEDVGFQSTVTFDAGLSMADFWMSTDGIDERYVSMRVKIIYGEGLYADFPNQDWHFEMDTRDPATKFRGAVHDGVLTLFKYIYDKKNNLAVVDTLFYEKASDEAAMG